MVIVTGYALMEKKGNKMTQAHKDAGVCHCGDDEAEKKCTCDHGHGEEQEQKAPHCGSKDGDCRCNDTAPKEHVDKMVAAHSHHLHHPKTVGERIAPYSRLITTLIVVLAFGIILSFIIGFSWLSVMEYWMGGYFVAFGVMQAISLKSSAAMFRQYDPLAMRVALYSYALPFIQIALGVAYFFMVWWAVVGLVALAVLVINVVGVDRVMRQNRTVRCGCLGESMNVPVGKVTLWEDLIMIGMVVMMLTYHAFNYLLISGGADVTSMPGMNM